MAGYDNPGQKLWTLLHLSESSDVPIGCKWTPYLVKFRDIT